MALYNLFSENGLTALFDHLKTTRTKADSNESAIGDLGTDLADLATETVSALGTKQDKLTFDSTPTSGSTKPVTSGGVATYVTNMVGDINSVLDTINGEVV